MLSPAAGSCDGKPATAAWKEPDPVYSASKDWWYWVRRAKRVMTADVPTLWPRKGFRTTDAPI